MIADEEGKSAGNGLFPALCVKMETLWNNSASGEL